MDPQIKNEFNEIKELFKGLFKELRLEVAKLTTQTAKHTTQLAKHTDQITRNTAQLTKHTEQITRNTAQLTRNTAQLTKNTDQIAKHTDQITENTAQLSRNTPLLAKLSADFEEFREFIHENMFTRKDYMDHLSTIDAMVTEVKESRRARLLFEAQFVDLDDKVHRHGKRIKRLESMRLI